jgi:glycosyltransferase involved in cell wall biosynthesis
VPRVTVVIATYNWSEVLPYAIGSVLDQTFTDFELMVIGDGCTDNSADVVGAVGDPRVAWLNLPANTRHQSGPNNEAIQRSDSELIAYLGHDDLWLPHHLAVLVDALGGEAGISHGSSLQIRPGEPAPTAFPCGDWTYHAGCWLPPTSLVHSRSLAEQVGGWRPPWETGAIEAESDLLARMVNAAGRPPIWVRDVTSAKLPASWRRDVYRTRPCHEQAAWLDRIRTGETWHHLIATTEEPEGDPLGRVRRAVYWTRRTLGPQSWRRRLALNGGPVDAAPVPDTPRSAERRWREQREFKGVDPPA